MLISFVELLIIYLYILRLFTLELDGKFALTRIIREPGCLSDSAQCT